jgi:hypothetical protein
MKKHKFKGACVAPIIVVRLSWVFHFKVKVVGLKIKCRCSKMHWLFKALLLYVMANKIKHCRITYLLLNNLWINGESFVANCDQLCFKLKPWALVPWRCLTFYHFNIPWTSWKLSCQVLPNSLNGFRGKNHYWS